MECQCFYEWRNKVAGTLRVPAWLSEASNRPVKYVMETNPYASPKHSNETRTQTPEEQHRACVWSAWLLTAVTCAFGPAALTVIWYFGLYIQEASLGNDLKMTEFEKRDTLYFTLPYVTGLSIVVAILVFMWKISQCRHTPTSDPQTPALEKNDN